MSMSYLAKYTVDGVDSNITGILHFNLEGYSLTRNIATSREFYCQAKRSRLAPKTTKVFALLKLNGLLS